MIAGRELVGDPAWQNFVFIDKINMIVYAQQVTDSAAQGFLFFGNLMAIQKGVDRFSVWGCLPMLVL